MMERVVCSTKCSCGEEIAFFIPGKEEICGNCLKKYIWNDANVTRHPTHVVYGEKHPSIDLLKLKYEEGFKDGVTSIKRTLTDWLTLKFTE
jgi:hypothetical protein